MDLPPSTLLKLVLQKSPLILKTTLLHTLSLSPTSSKWDLRTELTIKFLRDMLGPNSRTSSISKQQYLSTKDPGIKGQMWVSKVRFPVPEEDEIRQLLFKAIEEMGTGEEKWTQPSQAPLEAEWTGYRANVSPKEPEPAHLSDTEKYAELMKETTSKVTILYFHGGAMYLLDPATSRNVTSRLAKVTGGRVFSVRYRLAPQNPFPAALLDALTAYLTLLSPPPDSLHEPIPASEIVFGGDSAGGTLCTALLQLLLQFQRTSPPGKPPTVRFHGKDVELALPAGLALSSPWLDITRSLPSLESLAKYDYLPPPSQTQKITFPPCSAWPTNPPRADLYCEGSALLHPLVSPLAARDWRGAPPMLFSLGEEMLRDEDAVVAQRVAGQGGRVVWREFEGMPHCFALMFEGLEAAGCHFEEWGAFCRGVVEGGGVETSAEFIEVRGLRRRVVDVKNLTELSESQVEEYMRRAKERLERRAGGGAVEVRPML